MKHHQALLVIDMQNGSFTPETPRYDADGVVNRINQLAAEFREQGLPVVYIQHDGTGTGEFEKRSREWEILDELEVSPEDILVDKTANDVFYRSDLKAKLDQLKVNEIFITGCATDFCVESTVQSALTKEYQVVVVADGHTTAERPHITAEKIIAHYNWVWQNMLPTRGSLRVKRTEDILREMHRVEGGV